jgi:hypothetical protein
MIKRKQRSFSYAELTSGKVSYEELEKLAETGMLDETTMARARHLGRFFERVAKAIPNPDLKIGDVLTEDELQNFWRETADEGADIGQCPLLVH